MANNSNRIDREIIADQIIEAIGKSDMSRRKKRRAKRVMNGRLPYRQRARREVIDMAVSELIAEELIIVTADGAEAALDFDSIIDFIERLLPLLLKLIGLFG